MPRLWPVVVALALALPAVGCAKEEQPPPAEPAAADPAPADAPAGPNSALNQLNNAKKTLGAVDAKKRADNANIDRGDPAGDDPDAVGAPDTPAAAASP